MSGDGNLPAASGLIDCHTHYMPAGLGDQLRERLAGQFPLQRMVMARPAWRDLAVHEELMDRANVELAVIIGMSALVEGLRALGGSLNESIEAYNRALSAELAGSRRFVAAALVDPFGGKEAIAQLDRSLSLSHVVAVSLLASYDGVALDDPIFEPVFDVARHHDVPVMVHPSSVAKSWVETLRLERHFLQSGFGFFLDDSLCIFRMIVNGTFDKYPDVRFMFCQLGGVAPFCCGRWETHRDNARTLNRDLGTAIPAFFELPLGHYLSRIWLDMHTQDRHALELVIAETGDKGIVLGGDHPWTSFERGIPYSVAELTALDRPAETKRNIERNNALDLLGERVRSLL